jgi:hypothetical protein
MANQVQARLSGDDYQHLYSWQFVLELKMPRKKVRLVTLEDALAGSVDDVTVQHEVGTHEPDLFYQVKYHVDQRGAYSTEALIASKPGQASLLEKFWRTWHMLRAQSPERNIVLSLVSNWSWDSTDKLGSCLSGLNNGMKEEFFAASLQSDIGKLRYRLQTAINATEADFTAFMRCMRFRLGFDCMDELEKRIAERMEYLHLKYDKTALLVAVGIVRNCIETGRHEIMLADLEETLRRHDLYLPDDAEKCMTVYLVSIKEQRFDIEPDYVVDWRDYFIGDPNKKGHQLQDPSAWNGILLPELQALEAQINKETSCRLIRARGLARLSPWFAFGFTFSEVARYTIEVDQNGRLWRTDAHASPDFDLIFTNTNGSSEGEILDGEGATVAVGISVTGALDSDVRNFFASREDKVASLLLMQPERGLGRECLRNASDAVALADGVKNSVRAFVKKWNATRLLLFYFGPLSGACFIGHRLNAVCREIQIMEDQQPGYAPSFLLS